MESYRAKIVFSALLFMGVMTTVSVVYGQGSLVPATGPGPMMRTLLQIEPRTPIEALPYEIDVPGAYYLTGNLSTSGAGITIRTSGVSLDLGGFTLEGGAGNGIWVDGTYEDIAVFNGRIEGWSNAGGSAPTATNVTFTDIHAVKNGTVGIQLGHSGKILDSHASENEGDGISIGDDGIIARSTVRGNEGGGIVTGSSCTISDCTASDNAGDGVSAGPGSTVRSSTASGNAGNGIVVWLAGVIADSTAMNNTLHGFQLEESGVIRNSVSLGNGGHGIQTAYANLIVGCEFVFNSNYGLQGGASQTILDSSFVGNTSGGISVTANALIRDSLVADNQGIGIDASFGSTIRECNVAGNAGIGIQVNGSGVVAYNHVLNTTGTDPDAGSSSAGIVATGERTRIDQNHVVNSADYGIRVEGAHNFITRNTVSESGNSNYWIAGSNRYGPIIDVTGAGQTPVDGDSAPDTLLDAAGNPGDHPMANYAF